MNISHELQAYATQIGIQLPLETYLLPIAQEGLHAELPDGWEAYEADDDISSKYFYHHESASSSWEHPVAGYYKQRVVEMRNFVHQCADALGISSDDNVEMEKFAAEMAFCELPEGWIAHLDQEGRVYFQVPESDNEPAATATTTTWDHPYQEYFAQQLDLARRNNNNNSNQRPSREPFFHDPDQLQQQRQQQQSEKSDVHSQNSPATPPSRSTSIVYPSQNRRCTELAQQVQHHTKKGQEFLKSQRPKKFDLGSGDAAAAGAAVSGGGGFLSRTTVEYHPILGAPVLKGETRFDRTITSDDYDSIWGPPLPPSFSKQLRRENPPQEYDDWFGPPVRKGRAQKPTGAPKRVLGSGSEVRRQEQQEVQQQQVQQQQRVQPLQEDYYVNNPQVLDFARYIGVKVDLFLPFGSSSNAASADAQVEKSLLPFVAQLLQIPLPANWRPAQDPTTGKTYFANVQTKQSSWEHPLKEEFMKKLVSAREVQKISTSKQQQQILFPPLTPALQQIAAEHFCLDFNSDPGKRHKTNIELISCLQQAERFLNLRPSQQQQLQLPHGWEKHTTEEGHVYYANVEAGESSWKHPAIFELQRTVKQVVA